MHSLGLLAALGQALTRHAGDEAGEERHGLTGIEIALGVLVIPVAPIARNMADHGQVAANIIEQVGGSEQEILEATRVLAGAEAGKDGFIFLHDQGQIGPARPRLGDDGPAHMLQLDQLGLVGIDDGQIRHLAQEVLYRIERFGHAPAIIENALPAEDARLEFRRAHIEREAQEFQLAMTP